MGFVFDRIPVWGADPYREDRSAHLRIDGGA